MKKWSNISGICGLIVGIIILIFGIDLLGKPSNVALKFDPLEAFSSLYFSFSWWWWLRWVVLGALLLITYLVFFYWLGSNIYKKTK